MECVATWPSHSRSPYWNRVRPYLSVSDLPCVSCVVGSSYCFFSHLILQWNVPFCFQKRKQPSHFSNKKTQAWKVTTDPVSAGLRLSRVPSVISSLPRAPSCRVWFLSTCFLACGKSIMEQSVSSSVGEKAETSGRGRGEGYPPKSHAQ